MPHQPTKKIRKVKRKTPANAGTRRHGELPHTKMRQRRESAPGSYAVVSCSNCEVKACRHFPGPGQAPRTPKVVKTPVAYDGQCRFLRSPKGFFFWGRQRHVVRVLSCSVAVSHLVPRIACMTQAVFICRGEHLFRIRSKSGLLAFIR